MLFAVLVGLGLFLILIGLAIFAYSRLLKKARDDDESWRP